MQKRFRVGLALDRIMDAITTADERMLIYIPMKPRL
jgi:hypothetical protein